MDTHTCRQRPGDGPGPPGRAEREGQASVFLVGPLLSALRSLPSMMIAVLLEGPLDPGLPAGHLVRAVSDHRNHSAKKVSLSLCHRCKETEAQTG